MDTYTMIYLHIHDEDELLDFYTSMISKWMANTSEY
jgi:hypothetical protein